MQFFFLCDVRYFSSLFPHLSFHRHLPGNVFVQHVLIYILQTASHKQMHTESFVLSVPVFQDSEHSVPLSLDTSSCSGFKAQTGKKKKVSLSLLSYSPALSDSSCCILMHRVSQGGKMRKSSPITRCPPAGQGQGLQQPDRWYCHPLFSIAHTHQRTHAQRQRGGSHQLEKPRDSSVNGGGEEVK